MTKRTTVLWAVARHGPATVREIAHSLDASTRRVQAALARLHEDEGLVERVRRPSESRGPDPYQYRLVDQLPETPPERAT